MFLHTTVPARAGQAPVCDPVANRSAQVIDGPARCTVLTSRLIRLEWSSDGRFEDRASLVFVNRNVPLVEFTTRVERGWRVIETSHLVVRFRQNDRPFDARNLEILFSVGSERRTWRPGTPNHRNLKGTTRTLDQVDGATSLEPGLLSRDGWSVVDDSERPLFDEGDVPWAIPRPAGKRQDWYFFGHGHDYKGLLRDFVAVAGRIPMPPRFAFGAWWSRYWAYSAVELKRLVGEFESHDVPLDVLVIDMDWHITSPPPVVLQGKRTAAASGPYARVGIAPQGTRNAAAGGPPARIGMPPQGTRNAAAGRPPARTDKDPANEKPGWTGYTWNRELFPDPSELLAWLHQKGLQTTLNLHPASGIQPHEEQYPAMARAMGIDPSTKRYVPFDIVDRTFAQNYFDLVIHPLERQGVDFWWLDWQQSHTTQIPGLTPTWWLNYVHFTDMARQGRKRPLIFHRWGGLGNHRYQIGFSGDTIITWDSLAFQPYFTATAANVGFGYWSHDIGGHMRGVMSSPEMYARWIQFGVFSPILRTHATKNAAIERRIWAYPPEYFEPMRNAFLLRYALIPYIYTAARKTHDTGVSIVRPMYYEYPESDEAYNFTDEYMFGDDMMVAPIVQPMDNDSGRATRSVWIPPGEWIEWCTRTSFAGPALVQRSFALDQIPVYVRAGAIIPMQPKMRQTGEKPVDPLLLHVFPGSGSETWVYEDEGNTDGYQQGRFSWTPVRHARNDAGEVTIEIGPAEGDYPGMLAARGYEIHLLNAPAPTWVLVNGGRLPRRAEGEGWRHDRGARELTLTIAAHSVREPITVTLR